MVTIILGSFVLGYCTTGVVLTTRDYAKARAVSSR